MSELFDAYHVWLGIPPSEQPPNHYRLLGLREFESSPEVIDNAAQRVTLQLRGFLMGPEDKMAQRLLGEVSSAAACLLDPRWKENYDKALHVSLSAKLDPYRLRLTPVQPLNLPTAQVAPPQVMPPAKWPVAGQAPSAGPGVMTPAPLQPLLPLDVQTQPGANVDVPVVEVPSGPGAAVMNAKPSRRQTSGAMEILQNAKVIVGGLIGLVLGYFVVYFITGNDMAGVLPGSKKQVEEPIAAAPIPEEPGPPARSPPVSPTKPLRPPPSPVSSIPPKKSPEIAVPVFEAPPPATPTPQPAPALTPMPSTPEPSPAAPAAPPAAPAKKTKHPVPPITEQQKTLSELQSLYKLEFERGNKPEGRVAMIGFLVKTAHKLASDPTAQFVLLRDAYQRAIGLDDLVTAAELIDELELNFEVDGYLIRMQLLTEASKAARGPEDRLPLIQFALDMADYAQSTSRIEDLTKFANMIDSLVRPLAAKDLKTQATTRAVELRKITEDFGPVVVARRRLETEPTNAAASLIDGKYRCFVLGDWNDGLKRLARCDHAALADAAKKDIAGPSAEVKGTAIGDLWFGLATADPGLQGAFARAAWWYQQSVSAADGLEKVKLERRLEQISAMRLPARLTQPQDATPSLASARYMLTRVKSLEPTNILAGDLSGAWRTPGWTVRPGLLQLDKDAAFARLQSPVTPTGEYQVALVVRRYQVSPGVGMFVIGLPHLGSQFLAVIDYPLPNQRYASFLNISGVRRVEDNPTFKVTDTPSPRLRIEQHTIVCAVKLDEIDVLYDGQPLIEYRGDLTRLSLTKEWTVPDGRALFIGANQGGFYVDGWSVSPLRKADGSELPLLRSPQEVIPGQLSK
jgi:hypothetical protein